MNTRQRLRALLDVILREAEANPQFAQELEAALNSGLSERGSSRVGRAPHAELRKGGRRPRGVLDPFTVYALGETELRQQLSSLGVEELKDIVAEHGMDPTKLALKWKTPERLIDLVCQRVRERLHKGQAFEGRSDNHDAHVASSDPIGDSSDG